MASIYQYLYLAVVAILTFASVSRYKQGPYSFVPVTSFNTFILTVFMTFAIGLRPISSYFVDMSVYSFNLRRLRGETFVFNTDTDNVIFDNLLQWWGCNGFNEHLFFFIIAIVYFGCAYFGIRRLFPEHQHIAYLVFLGAFSTFSYSTNGIKAGAAASVFIMALSYMDKKWICFPLMLISLGFHHSMVLPIAAFLISCFVRNPRLFYIGWFVCFLLALFRVSYFQNIFGGIADEQGALYLLATSDTTDAHIGFRPDFVLYSAVPVWIGYKFEVRKRIALSSTYRTLMHFYLTANGAWMLCMYASFTNRIAYLSWFVYPIIIIYPYLDALNRDPFRYKKLRKVVLYHLLFTLFMYIVYYGILSLGR